MKKILGLILFIFAYIGLASATTLTGTLNNPDGSGFTGTLYLSIAQQAAVSSLGSCGGPKLIVPTAQIAIPISNGAIQGTWNIYGSDCTLPTGMPYNAILKDANGNTMFSTMWLITGTTQDVGTVYMGPATIPPTALLLVYGVGSPAGAACSAMSMYVQTDATGGAYLFPCINGTYSAQGGGGGGSGMSIGAAVTGGTARSVLFVDASGNLAQDNSYFNYNPSTHVLTVTNAIAANITGNANTATTLANLPGQCSGSQVAYGVDVGGNALCKTLNYSDIGSPPGSFPVTSVFSRTGVITSQTGDYSFSQISGTVSNSQLSGSGAITSYPAAGIPCSTGSAWCTSYSAVGTGTALALANSPTLITPVLGVATATSINGTSIPTSATLMTTTTSVLAAQMPALTGDVTSTAGTVATTLAGIGGVPFCSGFSPTAGQGFVYTTGGTPNPCYGAITIGATFQTNGTNNPVQNKLNFVNGQNIIITATITGNEEISCPNCAIAVPLGTSMGVDWPPSQNTAMDDEFTTAFNTSNIWTVVNQGSSTITDSLSNLVVSVPAHSGDSFVGVYQSIPATPYAVKAKIKLTGLAADAYYGGLAFRDSGTGYVVSFRMVNGNTIKVDHWTGPTASATNVFSASVDEMPSYLEVEDDGTNFDFMISQGGAGMLQVYSESRTAFLGSPGQVGYMGGSASSASAMVLGSDWFRRVL